MYTRTIREEYRQYKSDANDCKECKKIEQCTKSKNQTIVINRHIWKEYVEEASPIRHTNE